MAPVRTGASSGRPHRPDRRQRFRRNRRDATAMAGGRSTRLGAHPPGCDRRRRRVRQRLVEGVVPRRQRPPAPSAHGHGSPRGADGLQTAQDGVAAGVARGPFGASLNRRGVRSMLRTSLLGYRVDQYTPTQAQIALWAVVLYGNDGGLAPQALYATSTLRLRWAGDWKLLEASTVPGPVPVHGQATPSPAQELVDAAEDFKEFGYAPAA